MNPLNWVVNLLSELPPETEVVRYLDGHGIYTAAEMIEQIKMNSDTGKAYISDLFRTSRDFMIRKVKREQALDSRSSEC